MKQQAVIYCFGKIHSKLYYYKQRLSRAMTIFFLGKKELKIEPNKLEIQNKKDP